MEWTDLKDYLGMSKDALELFKTAYSTLPKGSNRDEIERKIKAAEDLLKRSDAHLAKQLGYQLCKCTFPPTPMLWRERERAYVCQQSDCGHRIEEYKKPGERSTPDYF